MYFHGKQNSTCLSTLHKIHNERWKVEGINWILPTFNTWSLFPFLNQIILVASTILRLISSSKKKIVWQMSALQLLLHQSNKYSRQSVAPELSICATTNFPPILT
ncbi:hypothetical protein LOAG_01887 [Loa loa]|uniref:Uncharacterized protein n=1 Tax=Loa loa TaxID=7209 RepID=A0A1S0U7Y2_LOALO|nr:hypothetical protein LOAG_01887 [Loa loa]EFO26599.1 hypothetical protein LOAG_01887 [Loa loa]